MRSRLLMASAFVVSFAAAPAAAEDLTIALASEPTSIDPHYHNLTPNNALTRHIFEPLIKQDENQSLEPGLATEWGVTDDPLVWEFKLREDVTFHDGSPFTAEDVAFTIERAPDVPNSPSSFGLYIDDIAEVEIVDDHTVRFHTENPVPLMANNLSTVAIISKKHAEGAATEDFNSGEAAVGTGPFKFASYTPGEEVEMEAYEDYWGDAPEWDSVTFRPITSASARVAGLLSGDIDVIEGVPTNDVASLEENEDVSIWQGISNRVIYIHLDSDREATPQITAKDGSEIENPLRDARVRKALSIAIDRESIVEDVMEGIAIPAGQLLPEGFFGVSENIDVPEYDPERAQELLAEAGYEDGFKMTVHGPAGRYINDEQVLQAAAQMWSRIGIETEVETIPVSVYFGRASDLEFSVMLVGWGAGSGEASSPLRALLATYEPEAGFGATNRGRYSNEEMDSLLKEALVTVDNDKRQDLLAEATEIAMEDVGLIPVHFQVNTWGTRDGLEYVPRTDEYTLATSVRSTD
ncbi:ABC transporter substrate-binding protein [Fodinicurvata sediminis]|uniref:ABC transporter substrate-binding protein n=1 Tax=Fodinicurvata sediminis TaxID=1121832 RepID=UPI000423B77E|nr:ABC transporter substrate-binding protein [Fodinicurvata sediminis]